MQLLKFCVLALRVKHTGQVDCLPRARNVLMVSLLHEMCYVTAAGQIEVRVVARTLYLNRLQMVVKSAEKMPRTCVCLGHSVFDA
jgi:hypothetical protein